MKKQTKPDLQTLTKMSKLTSLVYSTAGIGLVTVAAHVVIAAPPKNPLWMGE